MLINKDHDHPHMVRVVFQDADSHRDQSLLGSLAFITFGKAQYQWHPNRRNGYADPDGPPVTATIAGDAGTVYNLPAASLTVVRGRVGDSSQDSSRPAK